MSGTGCGTGCRPFLRRPRTTSARRYHGKRRRPAPGSARLGRQADHEVPFLSGKSRPGPRVCPANPQPAVRPPDGRLAALSSSPIAPLWAPPPPCDPSRRRPLATAKIYGTHPSARPAVMIMGKWRSQQPKSHDHQHGGPRLPWTPGHALWAVVPPSVLVVTGIFSVQFGAGLAARLFAQVPPAGVTALRLWTSAVVMVLVGARPLRNVVSGVMRRRAWREAAVVIAFGLTLAIMNYSIYQSFARIPLGISVTVEFLGPLGVAVASSRRALDLLWVGLAGAGVALLTRGGAALSHGSAPGGGGRGEVVAGLAFALLAGLAWAAYILLSRATGQRFPGSTGLAIAMVVAAIAITPVGVAAGQ